MFQPEFARRGLVATTPRAFELAHVACSPSGEGLALRTTEGQALKAPAKQIAATLGTTQAPQAGDTVDRSAWFRMARDQRLTQSREKELQAVERPRSQEPKR